MPGTPVPKGKYFTSLIHGTETRLNQTEAFKQGCSINIVPAPHPMFPMIAGDTRLAAVDFFMPSLKEALR